MYRNRILIRRLGIQPYQDILQAMQNFTFNRSKDTKDEIWLVEHFPVFTQGRAGKSKNLILPGNISVINSDRGGQITYHGPGQQLMYVLLKLQRYGLSVRNLVKLLEDTVINMLSEYEIRAYSLVEAPGVYIKKKKICSLALRIYKGCSFHGLALNINMDLSPFLHISPCGFSNIEMTQMSHWDTTITTDIVRPKLIRHFLLLLSNSFNT